jgi:hypothetical protein
MACDWQPHPQRPDLLRCTACGRTIDPAIFDRNSAGACLDWHAASPAVDLPHAVADFTPSAMQSPAPRKLAVITSYFNFAGRRSVDENYRRFLHEMAWWGVPLYTLEMALPGQDFPAAPLPSGDRFRIRLGAENILWQKEAALNLLERQLPPEYDAVAWIDADVLFFDRLWVQRTLDALAVAPVVQLWDSWHFADHFGKIAQTGQSVGDDGFRYRKNKGHPGGAWAARRSVFPLDPTHIIGGGDTLAIEAWLGMTNTYLQRQMSPQWLASHVIWAADAWQKVGGRIATLPGDCLHLYHGSRQNRLYADRSRWLQQHSYDPSRHVRINDGGLVEWTAEAPPALVEQVRDYMLYLRQEDDGL